MTRQNPFIQDLELSVRSGNALARAFPNLDLEQFLNLNLDILLTERNFGSRSLRELRELQANLRGEFEPNPPRESTASLEDEDHWGEAATLVETLNSILMANPHFRVVVNGDASLTLTLSSADDAIKLMRYRKGNP